MMTFDNIISWIMSAVVFGTIIMLSSCGEILTEKSGHLNLGVPGIMYISGFSAFYVAYSYENSTEHPYAFLAVVLPMLIALAVGALFGLLYSFMTTSLKCNQNVVGLIITSLGAGMGKFLSGVLFKEASAKAAFTASAFTKRLPINFSSHVMQGLWNTLFGYGFMIYLAVAVAVLLHLFFTKTRPGLNLRAVGESPATADAAGINVTKYKYVATVCGCALCGLASTVYLFMFSGGGGLWATTNNIEAIGWLAVALVIFSTWKPVHLIWGSYLFGLLYWAYNYAPAVFKISIPVQLWQMLPYVVTIVVLILTSMRKKRENQPPQGLGVPYFREER